MAGRAGIAGTAGNATTGVGGNGASTGTTGTGGAAGSAATGSAGTTGTGGTIGNGGTTGGAGASGAGGGAGAAGTGGGAGAAGTGGRGGATGGGGGSGGAGGTQTAMQIAAVLDGQQWLVPCGADLSLSNLVCVDYPTGGCPSRAAGPARWPSGYLSRNDHLTFGGTPGKTYDVTVRIRGIVEVGAYQNGTTESGHDGWYIGGEPKDYSSFSAYNVYALTVSSPVAVPSALASGQFYFLNAVNHPQAHYSYAIDYTVTISIDAGAEIGFFANSLNCRAIKNCDNTSVEKGGNYSGCNPITIADLPASTGITQPYYGQFMVMNVVSAVER